MAIRDGYVFDPSINDLNTQRDSGTSYIKTAKDSQGALAVTSTNIEVLVGDTKVGFIQSMSPSENRTIIKVQELGTEGVVQAVPGNTNGGQLSIQRFAVYNANLFKSLGFDGFEDGGQFTGNASQTNPFATLRHQRIPFTIKVKTHLPSGEDYIETYTDCWVASYQKTISAQQITISEQVTVQYSDVE